MDGSDDAKQQRLQVVLTELLKHQLSQSLAQVEASLLRWRTGDLGPFEAHAELLRHAARAEQLAARIAQSSPEDAGSVMRDAFDAELIDRDEFISLIGEQPEDVDPSPPIEQMYPQAPDKRAFVEELLTDGAVLVHVDARAEDTSVPPGFEDDPRLVLRFGYGLSPAIHDLTVDAEGLLGTLTFSGAPHRCVLPWHAVYAAVSEVSQQAMVWPDDVPPEVMDQMAGIGAGEAGEPVESPPPPKPSQPKKRRASHLKLVD